MGSEMCIRDRCMALSYSEPLDVTASKSLSTQVWPSSSPTLTPILMKDTLTGRSITARLDIDLSFYVCCRICRQTSAIPLNLYSSLVKMVFSLPSNSSIHSMMVLILSMALLTATRITLSLIPANLQVSKLFWIE